jgi:hypothetical protein
MRLSGGVCRVRAQVGTVCTGMLIGGSGVPAVLESRIRVVRRPGVCGYEYGPTHEGDVSAATTILVGYCNECGGTH